MKQVLLFSLLLLVKIVSAQNNMVSTPNNYNGLQIVEKAPFEKAIIHFNDGSSVEGIGRLKTTFSSDEDVIIFKIEEKDNDETWTVKDATGITIISDEGVKHYEYLKTSKSSFAKLYEVVTEGTIKLYKKRKDRYSSFDIGNVTFTEEPLYKDDELLKKTIYYVKRETEQYPTKIKDNYIKATAEYMKDCEELVEKIKNHEYNYSQLKDLVDYYNANCGE